MKALEAFKNETISLTRFAIVELWHCYSSRSIFTDRLSLAERILAAPREKARPISRIAGQCFEVRPFTFAAIRLGQSTVRQES